MTGGAGLARSVVVATLLLGCGGAAGSSVPHDPRQRSQAKLPSLGAAIVELGDAALGFPTPILFATLSGDGSRIAVIDEGGAVRERATMASGPGAELGSVTLGRDREPNGLAFSPDARLLAVTDAKEGVVVLDVQKRAKARTIPTKDPDVPPVFLSNSELAIGDRASIRIVNVRTGADTKTLSFPEGRAVVRSLAFAPKAGLLAACSFEKALVFRPDGSIAFQRELTYATAVGISDDGARVAFAEGGASRSVHVVDLATGDTRLEVSVRAEVERLWVYDDAVLVSERAYGEPPTLARHPMDGPVKRYNTATQAQGSAVAVAASGAAIAIARGTELFRVDPRSFERADAPSRHGESVTWLAVTPDDRYLVSSARDGKVLRWDLERPASAPFSLLDRKGPEAHRIAISPDGRLVAMETRDRYAGGLRVAAIDTGETTFELDSGWVSGLAFDGPTKLWVATNDGEVALWDLGAGERELSMPVTPGEGEDRLASTYWDGYLLSPKGVVFRPRGILREDETTGKARGFTLPAGLPGRELDDVTLACRVGAPTEVVCPGSVRTKAGGETSYVLRFLDLATGRVRLVSVPGAVQALTPSPDGSTFVLAISAAEKEPTAATHAAIVVVDAARGAEMKRRSMPEGASSIAMTRSGHVIVGHASGAIRMLEP